MKKIIMIFYPLLFLLLFSSCAKENLAELDSLVIEEDLAVTEYVEENPINVPVQERVMMDDIIIIPEGIEVELPTTQTPNGTVKPLYIKGNFTNVLTEMIKDGE